MQLTRSLIALLILGALAPLARADFTGNFALTPPDGQTFLNSVSASAGAWSYSASGSGSIVLDTTGAPASVLLFSEAVGLGGSSSNSLSIVSLQAGTLSFDYNATIGVGGTFTPIGGSFSYQLNSNVTTLTSDSTSSVFWNVEPGDTIIFATSAQGGQDSIFVPPPGPGIIPVPASGSTSVTISNFNFTPVPEPGTWAILAGLTSLSAVILRKKYFKAA